MNTSVNIGSSHESRLNQALLVYGKSDYNSYPIAIRLPPCTRSFTKTTVRDWRKVSC